MSDAISRQQAIDAVKRLSLGETDATRLAMRIEDYLERLPSAELSTNLAEVGTDCISRQAAIEALKNDMASLDHIIKGMSANDVRLDAYVSQRNQVNYDIYTINNLLPAQPEIIRCRECKFASGDSRICMKFDHSPIGELDFCSFAERREVNNESN